MAKRPICNFAFATQETTRKNAIFQRGQYWIEQRSDRPRDPRKYGVWINNSMIAYGGNLTRAKGLVTNLYLNRPEDTDISGEMEPTLKRLAKRFRMRLRSNLETDKPKTKKTTPKPSKARRPKAKKSAGAGGLPVDIRQPDLNTIIDQLTATAKERKEIKEKIPTLNKEQLQKLLLFLNLAYKRTSATTKLIKSIKTRLRGLS